MLRMEPGCNCYLGHVQRIREPILITKDGKPLAKLVPTEQPDDAIFGYMKGKVRIVGDIVSSVVPLEDWNCK